MYFFETLVRVHRAGEGAPYTGIKPEGEETEPAIEMADISVEKGSVDEIVNKISADVASKIHEFFNRVMETKKHTNESVDAGREYVEAYVTFIHYVENLHNAVSKIPSHGDGAEEKGHKENHKH